VTAPAPSRLLLVEDDRDLARGLVFNLEREGHRVAVAHDGAAARRAMRESSGPESSFDLVVLDLALPDADGLDLLKGWRGEGLDVPILCLTARCQETDVVSGLKLGADDYVTKPFGLAQLFARIEAVLRRARATQAKSAGAKAQSDATTDLLRFGEVRVDLAAHRVRRPDADEELTPIEADLLRYLLARRGRVLDRGQILKDLWGVERRHETRTLDNHVARLRKKIEIDPARPRFLTTVHGIGYRFEEA
jgi:two-component system, OmpR family, alkaline phosphatase synthesis response regulator PhoP